jgi:hypothetical protein
MSDASEPTPASLDLSIGHLKKSALRDLHSPRTACVRSCGSIISSSQMPPVSFLVLHPAPDRYYGFRPHGLRPSPKPISIKAYSSTKPIAYRLAIGSERAWRVGPKGALVWLCQSGPVMMDGLYDLLRLATACKTRGKARTV